MRAAAAAEKAGVPATAVVATGFLGQAKAFARALGIEGAAIAEYPGVIAGDAPETLAAKVRERVVPSILETFDAAAPVAEPAPQRAPEPGIGDVVVRGTFDKIQETFHERGWTDGMPIVPPTRDRVGRFLSFTDRDPAEVLGVLPPEAREATVHSVAVNGVMAGCRPEYLPLLLAAVEAVADPTFGLKHGGSTPGWEALVVVSGPCSRDLGFNTETGMLRVGTRANTSIGRFLRLFLRNVAGLRPGETDKGSLGLPFNVAIAEDEDAVAAIGWQPYRVDRGFGADDDVVTVRSVLGYSLPIYSGGATAAERLEPIVHMMRNTLDPWAFSGVWFKHFHPLLILGPDIAGAFATAGWSKDDLREALFERLTTEAYWFERFPFHIAGADKPLAELVEQGEADPLYARSDDAHRQIPLLLRPEWTDVLVGGDAGRNQAKLVVNCHVQGVPVSKAVRWARREQGA